MIRQPRGGGHTLFFFLVRIKKYTNRMRPCPERSRFLSPNVALQRGLPPGRRHREELHAVRYAVVPGARVCARATASHRGRTSCFAEHSPRRKSCPLLSEAVDVVHAPGLFISGLGPYEDDEDDAFETLILGPYAVGARDAQMKRVDFAHVFGSHAIPENVAPRFYTRDTVIPSVDMLRDFVSRRLTGRVPREHAACAANTAACVTTLRERCALMQELRRRCTQDPATQRDARRFLKNVFLFAMYSRRWAGPETPYPIAAHETRRNVGQHKPISLELRGKYVHVASDGDVRLRDAGTTRADETDSGRAIAMYYAHLQAAHTALARSAAHGFLTARLLLAIRPPTVDGSHWPAEERLWETLFAGERSVAMGTTCTRQVSADLLRSCRMLAPFLYKTPPAWMSFEGSVDNIQ